ncbi:MAG: hypothetical protein ACOY3P_00915, partial [Planctomycetota bacterium]
MFPPDQYALIDFGQGRRLERIAGMVLDRPCPTAENLPKHDPAAWSAADARFERGNAESGHWHCRGELPERWTLPHHRFVFELKRAPFGHVGLFPEQAENWNWLEQICTKPGATGSASASASADETSGATGSASAGTGPPSNDRLRILNLFAYTGGSTLAVALGGAEVTHVDAAKNVVAWARRNAELSGLADAPIRWIADDAVKFCKRELR